MGSKPFLSVYLSPLCDVCQTRTLHTDRWRSATTRNVAPVAETPLEPTLVYLRGRNDGGRRVLGNVGSLRGCDALVRLHPLVTDRPTAAR